MSRSADDVDVEIGRALKARRLDLGLSQESVAGDLGITFQQLQKYEKGLNRVAASTLYRLAKILDREPQAFLPRAKGERLEQNQHTPRVRKILDAFQDLTPAEQRACFLDMVDFGGKSSPITRAPATRAPARAKRGRK